MSVRGSGEGVLRAPLSGSARAAHAQPSPGAPYGVPATDPPPPPFPSQPHHAIAPPAPGKITEEDGPYTSRRCLMSGERIIAGPFTSSKDFGCGLPRSTVFVTNQRLVINSHLTWFCCVRHDVHESIFFKSIYSISIGKSKDYRAGIAAIVTLIIGFFFMVLGFSTGADWLGVFGLTVMIGAVLAIVTFILMEVMAKGSNMLVEYALGKVSPGLSNAMMPANPVQFATCRIASADCLEVIRAVLSHPDTNLLSFAGTGGPASV